MRGAPFTRTRSFLIHSWMRAWVGAVEHPYFAVTGADGSFELKNLPPGEYTVEAWHEQYGTQELKVTVPPSGKQEATFTFQSAPIKGE